jgi:hypothetical protein
VKTDLRIEIPAYSARRGRFDVVTVPPLQYLAIDGAGDPNTAASYRDALQTIFPVAYALKFFSKRELDRDYVVMPLEGLWTAADPALFTAARDKSRWTWTMLCCLPAWITDAHVDTARAAAAAKGAPATDLLRVASLDEGLCVQTLHVGPYDDEGPVLADLHDRVIPELGMRMTGRHHEIYLSDARRTAPEKLRTILRQPVAPR